MVHGMDIPTADVTGFAVAAARSRAMLDPLGVPLDHDHDERLRAPPAAALALLRARPGGLAARRVRRLRRRGRVGVRRLPRAHAPPRRHAAERPAARPRRLRDRPRGRSLEPAREAPRAGAVGGGAGEPAGLPRRPRARPQLRPLPQVHLDLHLPAGARRRRRRASTGPPPPTSVLRWVRHFSNHRVYVNEMRAVVAEADRRGFDAPWVGAARRRILSSTARRAAHSLGAGRGGGRRAGLRAGQDPRRAATSASSALTRR